MAIKYFVDKKNKKTVAVLEGCRWDSINRINKMLRRGVNDELYVGWDSPYLMPNTFRAVVVCSEQDEYDVEEGKRQAKNKLMRNYNKSMDKRIAQYRNYLLRKAELLN